MGDDSLQCVIPHRRNLFDEISLIDDSLHNILFSSQSFFTVITGDETLSHLLRLSSTMHTKSQL
jgi:hypothetical protein